MNTWFADSVNTLSGLISETVAQPGRRSGPGTPSLGGSMKLRKRVVDTVNLADLLAKMANVYRAWLWLRDHFDS